MQHVYEVDNQKRVSADEIWKASPEFLAEARKLCSAFPASSAEFRRNLRAFGIDLPLPEQGDTASSRPEPRTRADLLEIIEGLQGVARTRAMGEPDQAAWQELSLEIDLHIEGIADLVISNPALEAELIPLLNAEDRLAIEKALDLRRALAAKDLAAVLGLLGRDDLVRHLGET